jgi:hypothetical protein
VSLKSGCREKVFYVVTPIGEFGKMLDAAKELAAKHEGKESWAKFYPRTFHFKMVGP